MVEIAHQGRARIAIGHVPRRAAHVDIDDLGPFASAMRAPSAIQSVSQPASWTTWGPIALPFHPQPRVTLAGRKAAQAIISDTTSPAPSRAARRRNGASVTPDIGARNTGLARLTFPIASGADGARS